MIRQNFKSWLDKKMMDMLVGPVLRLVNYNVGNRKHCPLIKCNRPCMRRKIVSNRHWCHLLWFIKYIHTGCFYKLLPINLVWGPFKYSKSNFNPVHVFLHFKSFCLVVLKVIFASKLSELQQFENWAANYQGWKWGKLLRVEIRQKKLTNAINKI